MNAAPELPPLDPGRLDSADGDLDRRIETLRRLLAEARLSPSRRNLARAELRAALTDLREAA